MNETEQSERWTLDGARERLARAVAAAAAVRPVGAREGVCADSRPAIPTQGDKVLEEVSSERAAQDAKWGEQNHPNGTPGMWHMTTLDPLSRRVACDGAARDGTVTWGHILTEEVAEALAESDPSALRAELLQVAAVAVAWVEAIDRKAAK